MRTILLFKNLKVKNKAHKNFSFFVNIDHSERLAEKFNNENFKSVVIHSDTSRLDKKQDYQTKKNLLIVK